jgi:hypothetical protein
VLQRAIALLPAEHRPTVPVVLVDPATVRVATPELRRKINGEIGGFVIPGRRVVYMSRRGKYYRAAADGDAFALHALAAEIAHELEHVDGRGDEDAYARQIRVFTAFVESERVDRDRGERLLEDLRRLLARHRR